MQHPLLVATGFLLLILVQVITVLSIAQSHALLMPIVHY
jgi:hypothetical protein